MFLIFGLLAITVGILNFFVPDSWIRWWISYQNTMRGVQTKITKQTLFYGRMSGVGAIILGLLAIYASFNGF